MPAEKQKHHALGKSVKLASRVNTAPWTVGKHDSVDSGDGGWSQCRQNYNLVGIHFV